ncbi:type II toxin-antitoxin system RelE/ParE family toxin [Azospirillum rugosum]|uniref:Toxin ParE1/3/4 n=1 Tax=Azospirillum rugosum TaxID=416170 RepID=A0ABS4SS67_9PROT|nr:type II toxin-antitoxin system RelE/ParE family toxin [Azospirillum rugosum]MBP2295404.1 toxin ParE1/3/4 [Azospirillum rugosum]MDQ0528779.1 toxin ParE1/3/4 [Azospirillum rugosum]
MARIIIAPRARTDLIDIGSYIGAANPAAADRLIQRFGDTFERLSERPLSGRPRAEIRPNLRSVPIDRYVIFYRPTEDGVEIVRVLHSARDVAPLFEGARRLEE